MERCHRFHRIAQIQIDIYFPLIVNCADVDDTPSCHALQMATTCVTLIIKSVAFARCRRRATNVTGGSADDAAVTADDSLFCARVEGSRHEKIPLKFRVNIGTFGNDEKIA